MQAGNSFGELAVIRSAPRAASAITNQETYMAALDSDNFRRILHFEQNQKIEKKMRFFKETMLGDMDYNDQVKIAYYFTSKHYKKNEIIYKQNEPVKMVYIIKRGRVELHHSHMSDMLDLGSIEKNQNLKKVLEKNALEMYGIVNKHKVNQKVSEIGEKNLLMDWTESYKEPRQLYTSHVVTEEVVLYECTLTNFNWIRETYPDLWKFLKTKIDSKNNARREYIENSEAIR